MNRFKGQTGMSLVEATIILLVLMLLTGVLAPSINDFVNDAKDVKVKEDCEAIGVSVMRLTRDVGSCLKLDGTFTNGKPTANCDKNKRVDLLYSNGPEVTGSHLTGDATTNFSSSEIDANLNWDYNGAQADSLEDQLVTNQPSYITPADVAHHNSSASGSGTKLKGYEVPGPQFYLGWRGGYLTAPIGPDPWGRKYLVNSVFLATATNANAGSGNGEKSGGWGNDVFCISGGRNTFFETSFGGDGAAKFGTTRKGDDFIYIISGSSR